MTNEIVRAHFERLKSDAAYREAFKVILDQENANTARLSANTERAALDYQRVALDHQSGMQSHDATIRYSDIAIRSLLILAGGAAVAILSFAGSKGVDVAAYASALSLFGYAAAGAVATAGVSYLAQMCFSKDLDDIGSFIQICAIGVWLFSLFAFIEGVQKTAEAVGARPATSSSPPQPDGGGNGEI